MSKEENKATSRRFYEELFNRGNLDAAEEIVTPDFVLHDPNIPEQPRGPDGLKRFVAIYRDAFPDIEFTVDSGSCRASPLASAGPRLPHRAAFPARP